jgi:hypothetical protein
MSVQERIPPTLKNSVWLQYIGENNNAKCYCCNVENITRDDFLCGFFISEEHGGAIHLANLRPICSLCYQSIGDMNMEDFVEKYGLGKNFKYKYFKEKYEAMHTNSEYCSKMCADITVALEELSGDIDQINHNLDQISSDIDEMYDQTNELCKKYGIDDDETY